MNDEVVMDIAAMLADQERRAAAAQAEGLPALRRLVEVAQQDSGQSRVCARFLLGLYNGRHWHFDMAELRLLDQSLHDDCLAVLRLDQRPAREVHQYIPNGHQVFESLKARWVTDRDRQRWAAEQQ